MAVGEAARGQGKRRRHKVAYGSQKGIRLGVKFNRPVLQRVGVQLAYRTYT